MPVQAYLFPAPGNGAWPRLTRQGFCYPVAGMHMAIEKLVTALADLDHTLVYVEGKMVKPSQCFRYGIDPPHYLFNTNCPDELKEKVESIFRKYVPGWDANLVIGAKSKDEKK